jgi:hypothetical protein
MTCSRVDFVSYRKRMSLEIILCLILDRTLVSFSPRTTFTFTLAIQVLNFFQDFTWKKYVKNLCQSQVRHVKIKLIIMGSVVSNVFKQWNQSVIFALALVQHLQNHISLQCQTGPDNCKITTK